MLKSLSNKDNKLLEELGKTCKKLRKEIGLTANQMAKICEVSDKHIYAFEKGDVNSLNIFCKYLEKIYINNRAWEIFEIIRSL